MSEAEAARFKERNATTGHRFAVTHWRRGVDLNLQDPSISRSFCGLRAISILWRALASVRTPKNFCVGVRSPLLDDGPTVPGNAARFFGI